MALECIMFWADWFPLDPLTGETSKFVLVYDSLKAKGTTFPKKITYFKGQELSNSQRMQAETPKVEEKKPENIPMEKAKPQQTQMSDKDLKDNCENLLSRYEDNKAFVLSLLTIEDESNLDKETFLMCVSNFEEILKEYQKSVEMLFAGSQTIQDKYLTPLISSQEWISNFLCDYEDWRDNKTNYKAFRAKYMNDFAKATKPSSNNKKALKPHEQPIVEELDEELEESSYNQKNSQNTESKNKDNFFQAEIPKEQIIKEVPQEIKPNIEPIEKPKFTSENQNATNFQKKNESPSNLSFKSAFAVPGKIEPKKKYNFQSDQEYATPDEKPKSNFLASQKMETKKEPSFHFKTEPHIKPDIDSNTQTLNNFIMPTPQEKKPDPVIPQLNFPSKTQTPEITINRFPKTTPSEEEYNRLKSELEKLDAKKNSMQKENNLLSSNLSKLKRGKETLKIQIDGMKVKIKNLNSHPQATKRLNSPGIFTPMRKRLDIDDALSFTSDATSINILKDLHSPMMNKKNNYIENFEEKTHRPFEYTETNRIKKYKSLNNEMIFPYKNSEEYYYSNKSKNFKGELARCQSGLEKVAIRNPQQLDKFKIACLKDKNACYDDGVLQVGVLSSLFSSINPGKKLRMAVYYGNKTEIPIEDVELRFEGSGEGCMMWCKPSRIESIIAPKSQVKQEFLIDVSRIPYKPIKVTFTGTHSSELLNTNISIPMAISKFMEFSYNDPEVLTSKWKQLSSICLFKSQVFELNPAIAKGAPDFKRYFATLVELSPEREIDYIVGASHMKMASAFTINFSNSEFLLKINALPSSRCLFQIACEREGESIAEHIVKSLEFLFSAK